MKLRTGAWQRYCLDRRKITTFAYHSACLYTAHLPLRSSRGPSPSRSPRPKRRHRGRYPGTHGTGLPSCGRHQVLRNPPPRVNARPPFSFSKWRVRNSAELLGLRRCFSQIYFSSAHDQFHGRRRKILPSKKRVCVESWLTAGLLKLENHEAKLQTIR